MVKSMNKLHYGKERILYLYLIMALVSVVIVVIATWILYRASFEQQGLRLKELAQSRARLIEASFQQNISGGLSDSDIAFERTLELLRESHKNYAGFGMTGEFTVAKLENREVHFLTSHRHDDPFGTRAEHSPFSLGSEIAEPIQQALSGKSGVMVGKDYRGKLVLAAYEPVKFEDNIIGIVAKIDMSEIRAPFIDAGIVTAISAIFAIFIGTLAFRRVSDPVLATLIESEERYRQLVELSPDGIILHSKGVVVFANSSAAIMAGGSVPEDIIGRSVLSFVHPDYREFVQNRISVMMKENKKLPLAEEKFIRLDGSSLDVEVTSMPVIYMKQPAVQLVFRDIAERKSRDEERSRLVKAIEQSAETVVITDIDGNIQYVNPFFEKITGYTKEEAIGKTPRVLKSGKHSESFYKNLWDTITSGKVWAGDFVNKRKDGTFYEEEATISPVFDKNGEIVNYVAVKRDVTHEKLLQRAKEYFTAVTSHELRTPVTKLKLVKKLLDEITISEEKKEKFEKVLLILDEADRSLHHVLMETELLADLSLTQTEKILGRVFIHNNLSISIDIARDSIVKEGREVNIISKSDNLPVKTEISGNNEMIKTVFDNILSNAIKYTPDGKNVHITGSVYGDFVEVEVVDEGIGIPKETKEQIFEPYYSLSNVLNYSTGQYKYKGGGVGLGLTISRMIMEYHNGELFVESDGEGKGVKVTLRFPVINHE